MKTNIETKKQYTLILTQEEADWLSNYLQNSPQGEDEQHSDSIMRSQFWKALNPKQEASS